MLKTALFLALTSAAAILSGCSGADEPAPVAVSTPGATPSDGTDPSGPPPCPTAGASSDKPALPASPVAACHGYYASRYYGSAWLHLVPQGCMWSTSLLLTADSVAVELSGSKRTGHWSGDEYYFTVTLDGNSSTPDTIAYTFSRTTAEPSK